MNGEGAGKVGRFKPFSLLRVVGVVATHRSSEPLSGVRSPHHLIFTSLC